jgi:hypothetical protein
MRALLIDNPLTRAQTRHVMRMGLMGRKPRFALAFALLMLLGSIVILITPYIEPISGVLNIPLRIITRTVNDMLQLIIVITGIALLVQGASLSGLASRMASGALARERRGRTWEPLVLTGISTWRIVLGKWGAVVRLVWARYRAAILLRPLVGIWLLLALHQFNSWAQISQTQGGAGVQTPPMIFEPLPLLTACIIMLIAPGVFILLSAAIGMLASSITSTEAAAARVGGAIGFGVVLLYIGGLLGIVALSPVILIDESSAAFILLLVGIFLTPGELGIAGLAIITTDQSAPLSGFYFLGAAVWCALALLATAGLLAGAAWASHRGGASVA